jgi:UDP-N-acetylmuramate--alanine ligase
VPFYGFAVMCIDHPEVQSLIGQIEDRRIITYGMSPQADIRCVDIRVENRTTMFTVVIRDRRRGESRTIDGLTLSIPGEHNVVNATGAIAIAIHLGIPDDAVRTGLSGFGGVKRRFTRTGDWNGVDVFDDYGHHPVEIAAVLKAGRSVTPGHVIAVVQPHRYTRLRDLFDDFCSCFNDADTVLVAPVYPAGETPIDGISGEALVDGLKARGHRDARSLADREDLAATIASIARPGDSVICLGAGSISQWAQALPGELNRLDA